MLYNHTAKRLKVALTGHEHTVIADVLDWRHGRLPAAWRLGWEQGLIGGRRPLKGRKPADRRVRVERPHSPYFRYTGPGQLVAKPAANMELTPGARFFSRLRAFAFGRPLSNVEELGERLSKRKALAIFSSLLV